MAAELQLFPISAKAAADYYNKMYAIGNLWEQGQITTAHEHLATSIVIRIMSDLYGNAAFHDQTRGKAIVSSAANKWWMKALLPVRYIK